MQEKNIEGGGVKPQGCRRRRIQRVQISGVKEKKKTRGSDLRVQEKENAGGSYLRGVGEGEHKRFRSQGCRRRRIQGVQISGV